MAGWQAVWSEGEVEGRGLLPHLLGRMRRQARVDSTSRRRAGFMDTRTDGSLHRGGGGGNFLKEISIFLSIFLYFPSFFSGFSFFSLAFSGAIRKLGRESDPPIPPPPNADHKTHNCSQAFVRQVSVPSSLPSSTERTGSNKP